MKKKLILPVILDLVSKTENNIARIKLLIKKLENWDKEISDLDLDDILLWISKLNKPLESGFETIIEGIFDGNNMIWVDNKKYVVPSNYSSKSKIIQWDNLKLKISSEGNMIYKVILQVNRKNIKWLITKNDDWKFVALWDDEKIYNLNQAAVSFFHGKPWDEAILIINSDKKCDYAALESIANIDL